LILSKAILCTGGLEDLRAQINVAQNQKCFVLKDLPIFCALAALISPRQGFQPNRWRESLACITANRQSQHMEVFQMCP
jgi:hypothetical protein